MSCEVGHERSMGNRAFTHSPKRVPDEKNLMKLIAEAKGDSLYFHPNGKHGVLLRDNSPAQLVEIHSMKAVGKLLGVKWPQTVCFTDNRIVLSGASGEIAVYDLKTQKQLNAAKAIMPKGDGNGLLINSLKIPLKEIEIGYPDHSEGISWYSFKSERVTTIAHVQGPLGYMPVTRYISMAPDHGSYVQLAIYQYDLDKKQPSERSMVHWRYIADHSELGSVDVVPKPRKTPGFMEAADRCVMTAGEVVVVRTNFNDRIIGTNLRTGATNFDKKFKKPVHCLCYLAATDSIAIAVGNAIEGIDANGAITRFGYDAEDNLTSLTDPVGNVTMFVRDTLQRVTTRRDPLSKETSYLYDPEGNVKEIIDRNGKTRSFDFDPLNRAIIERRKLANNSVIETVQSSYDAVGNRLAISSGNTQYAWTYDVLNRPTSENNAGTINLPALLLTSQFDAVGNRTAVFDNLGVRVDSVYSDRNELLSKSWTGSSIDDLKIRFAYNDRSDRVAATRFSDAAGTTKVGSSIYGFDASGRKTSVTHRNAVDQAIAQFDYGYDLANQLVSETNRGEQINYSYDPVGQLTAADRSTYVDEFYSFNLNGSRLTSHRQSTTSTIGPNNQLLSDGQFNYQYDLEGNLILRTAIIGGAKTEYRYDNLNRLVELTEKDSFGATLSTSTYRYDVLGRRIEKIENGQTTRTLFDGENAWLDANASNTITARYLFGDTIDENLARYRPADGPTSGAKSAGAWYLADKLGSITTTTNLTGTLVASAYYDSFGNQLAATNTAYLDRYSFAGRELNTSGLYHNRARAFNSATGTFIQQDPISFESKDANLYRYAFNVGLNAADPTGELSVSDYAVKLKNISLKVAQNCIGKIAEKQFRRTALDISLGLILAILGKGGGYGNRTVFQKDPNVIVACAKKDP